MQRIPSDEIQEADIQAWAWEYVDSIFHRLRPFVAQRTESVVSRLGRVLDAFALERVGTHHFSSMTGYGHGDPGREVLDRLFARVLGAEKAAVRVHIVKVPIA